MVYTPQYDIGDAQDAIVDVLVGFVVVLAQNIQLIAFLVIFGIIIELTTHFFSGLFGMIGRRR